MRRALLVLALGLAFAPSASAQEITSTQVEVEAGVADFNRELSGRLRPGPCWGARAIIPMRSELALVMGYQGAATRVQGIAAQGGLLASNGGFAAARLGLPRPYAIRPYAFAGLGLLRSTVPSAARELFSSDTAGIVPAGLGLEGDVAGHFSIGARLTYNLVFDNDLDPGSGSLTADLWSATLTGAYQF